MADFTFSMSFNQADIAKKGEGDYAVGVANCIIEALNRVMPNGFRMHPPVFDEDDALFIQVESEVPDGGFERV